MSEREDSFEPGPSSDARFQRLTSAAVPAIAGRPIEKALAAYAAYLVAALIGCIPLLISFLPVFLTAVFGVFGYAAIAAVPIAIAVGIPLYLSVSTSSLPGWAVLFVLATPGVLVFGAGMLIEIASRERFHLPGVYAWVAVATCLFGGRLAFTFESRLRGAVVASGVLTIVAIVGAFQVLPWW